MEENNIQFSDADGAAFFMLLIVSSSFIFYLVDSAPGEVMRIVGSYLSDYGIDGFYDIFSMNFMILLLATFGTYNMRNYIFSITLNISKLIINFGIFTPYLTLAVLYDFIRLLLALFYDIIRTTWTKDSWTHLKDPMHILVYAQFISFNKVR